MTNTDAPHLAHLPAAQRDRWAQMLAALTPEATCRECGGKAERDGMHWCPACRVKAEAEP